MGNTPLSEAAAKIEAMKRKAEVTLRAEPWWLIEIETGQAKILIKLNRGKIDRIEQTEIIEI